MKDPVKDFEDLNNRIDILFEGLGWLNPGNWFNDKSKPNEPNKGFKRGEAATKYLNKIESGECPRGTSNGRFTSEPGSDKAYFYDKKGNQTGFVENIKPFLNKAGITKQTLRCYNIVKDPLKIGWLFDGNFDATILGWDSKLKKIIFQGKWNGGFFKGINYKHPEEKTPATEKRNYKYFILQKGKEIGPYSSVQITKAIQKNIINLETVIRPENSAEYQHVKDNPLFSFLLQNSKATTTPKTNTVAKPFVKPVAIKTLKRK